MNSNKLIILSGTVTPLLNRAFGETKWQQEAHGNLVSFTALENGERVKKEDTIFLRNIPSFSELINIKKVKFNNDYFQLFNRKCKNDSNFRTSPITLTRKSYAESLATESGPIVMVCLSQLEAALPKSVKSKETA